MNFVIGSQGRLGKRLVQALEGENVIALERSLYMNWWQDNAIDAISYYFDKAVGREAATLFVASGVLDPSRAIDEHNRVNYQLPKNLIQGASKVGIRTITFGTVMERLAKDTANPYIASKIRLGDFISQYTNELCSPLHIQIHTLYGGGSPNSFMFLGQMLKSLTTKTVFKMSSGAQLREYHHIDDDILAIFTLLRSSVTGLTDLSHGQPVTLKEIATHVFNVFECPDLLDVGAIVSPDQDIYHLPFTRTTSLSDVQFREPLSGIVAYLKDHLI